MNESNKPAERITMEGVFLYGMRNADGHPYFFWSEGIDAPIWTASFVTLEGITKEDWTVKVNDAGIKSARVKFPVRVSFVPYDAEKRQANSVVAKKLPEASGILDEIL